MRSYIAIAGLVAIVSAKTISVTDTVDVTITSCAPTVTNCPYDPVSPDATTTDGTWDDWSSSTSTAVDPASTGTWDDWTTSTSSIPVDEISTSTGTWDDWTSTSYSVDPTSTGTWDDWTSTTGTPVDATSTSTGTWDDWESSSTPVAPASSSAYWPVGESSAVAPTGTGAWSSPSNQVSPATYTGAASSNNAGAALAGLAAIAAMVIA